LAGTPAYSLSLLPSVLAFLKKSNCWAHCLCYKDSGGRRRSKARLAAAEADLGVAGSAGCTAIGAAAGPVDWPGVEKDNEPVQAIAPFEMDGEILILDGRQRDVGRAGYGHAPFVVGDVVERLGGNVAVDVAAAAADGGGRQI